MVYGETKGLAHCGGLFLLDTKTAGLNATQCSTSDTIQAGIHSVFGDIGYYRAKAKWSDDWTLTLKRDALLGSAGFTSDFRYISLSATASSNPSITSELTVHTADSSFYAGTVLGKGKPVLATVRWESKNKNDEIHEIEGDWQTSYIRKGFVVGASYKKHHFQTHLEQIHTTPVNATSEYFIKDSSQIFIWDSRYRHDFGKSALNMQHVAISVQSNIIGNSYRDGSTKRFMYLPIKSRLYYDNIQWENDLFEVDARGILAYGKMEKDNRRFFETLAPNRLLPASVIQVLSFSFLQMNYLIEADLNIAAATLGGYFNPHFNITGNMQITPKAGLHGYYTYNDLEIEKKSETTSFIGYNSETEWWFWSLESTGLIASLGVSLDKTSQDKSRGLSLEWNATQIIPIKTDLREKTDTKPAGKSSTKNPEGASPSGIFKNGFASGLAIRYRF